MPRWRPFMVRSAAADADINTLSDNEPAGHARSAFENRQAKTTWLRGDASAARVDGARVRSAPVQPDPMGPDGIHPCAPPRHIQEFRVDRPPGRGARHDRTKPTAVASYPRWKVGTGGLGAGLGVARATHHSIPRQTGRSLPAMPSGDARKYRARSSTVPECPMPVAHCQW